MKTSDNFKVVQNSVTSYSTIFNDFVPSEFPNSMDFRPVTKKPKLDVIQSSSGSSSSSCRSSPASNTKEKQSLLDELWGDDWSEDVIESCVQLETQICSQLTTTQRATVEQPQNAVSVSGKAGKLQNTKELPDDYSGRFVNNVHSKSSFRVPLRRTASGGDWSRAICNGSQYSNLQAVSLAIESNKIKDKDSNALSSKFENLSLEYKKLQERYQAKEGETSLLRTHLISTQKEVEKQKKEKATEIESIKQTMQASINDLIKEIDSLKTQLEFKSMEAEAVATKNQKAHTGNRVLPESPIPKHKIINNCFNRSQIPETNSDPQNKKNVHGSNSYNLLDLSHAKKWVSVHNCHVLHQLITPNIFHNSKLEPNYLDPPRSVSKPSLLSDLIDDDDCGRNEMKSIPSPQPGTSKSTFEFNVFRESRKDLHSPCRQNGGDRNWLTLSVRTRHKELHTSGSVLEECHLQLMKLINLTDLDSEHALQLIKRVVLTCTKILWELQARLVDADKQKNFIEREKELLLLGYTYTPLEEEYNLLDNKPWYRNEQGIEARRALGLLTALVQTAKHMVYIILPSIIPGLASPNNSSGGVETLFKSVEMDDTISNSKQKNLSAVINRCDNDRPLKRFKLSNDSSSSDKDGKPKLLDLLNIIKNIVEHIGKQRRTLMFEGVLAGVTIFVTSLLQTETELSQDMQNAITKIVEQIVFSRPGPTVILELFHLLLAAVHCSAITNSLCCHSADKTCLEGYTHVTFTPDTCIMQVLCLLVRLVPTDRRFLITDVYTAWLLSIFIAGGNGPSWLYSDPTKTTCQCRPNVSQLALILLGEVCNVYNSKSAEEYTEVLERILQRGVFLIHKLLYKDEHFVVNAGDCEGYYELFLHAVSTFEPPIPLHQASKEVLENLCQQEAVRQPLHVVDAQSEELRSVLSSLYDTPNEDFMEND